MKKLFIICLVLLLPAMAMAMEIKLEFDASPHPASENITAYKFYKGATQAGVIADTAHLIKTMPLSEDTNPSPAIVGITLTGLTNEAACFGVTAFNGFESGLSNIVCATAPTQPPPTPPTGLTIKERIWSFIQKVKDWYLSRR